MEDNLPQAERPGRRVGQRWVAASALVAVFCCAPALLLIVSLDRTALLGEVYVRAIAGQSPALAEVFGDFVSPNAATNRAALHADIARDLAWLGGKEVSALRASHEETLSGQEAILVRFEVVEKGSGAPSSTAVLRVKTGHWLMLSYIRTVEVVTPP